ncbi:peptidylprolyl isomerase [bacterium]|nr:peptidylprolyl isomerase [bacterium]
MTMFWGCGKNSPTLARIGNRFTITEDDFKEVAAVFQKADTPEEKLENLNNRLNDMIDTKIILLSAYDAGYDQDSTVLAAKKSTQAQNCLTQLFQLEIVNKFIPESELRDMYAKSGKALVVRQILISVAPNSDSIEVVLQKKIAEDIMEKLKNGENFEFLANRYSNDRRTAVRGGLMDTLHYTMAGDPIQEAAFSMKKGRISDIIEDNAGFHILKLENVKKLEQPPYKEMRPKLKSKIQRSKNEAIGTAAQEYWDNLKEEKHVAWQEDNMDSLLGIMRPWNSSLKDSLIGGLDGLPESMKSMPLVIHDNGPVTVLDFRNWMSTITGDQDRIRGGVRNRRALEYYLNNLMMSQLLSEIAEKKGLHKHPDVVKNVHRVMESKMVQFFIEREIYGTIEPTDQELGQYYEANLADKYTPAPRLRVQEIVVDNEPMAYQIIAWAQAGQDFQKLHDKHSIKPNKDKNKGIVIIRNKRSNLFACADTLAENEIGGPIILSDTRYSVIKLLMHEDLPPDPLDKILYRVRNDLINETKRTKKEAWLAEHRQDYTISVNNALLQKIADSL